MKTYNNVPIKRQVQKLLFSDLNITGKTVTGLAGSNPQEYINIIKTELNPIDVKLYDINPQPFSVVGNIVSAEPTNIMDCDFCSSIVNEGYLYLIK